jgi:class 3 adenylate cyclase
VRIGLHEGDVIVRGDDLFGEGVNVAARLEPLAEPGGICVSESLYRSVQNTTKIRAVFDGNAVVLTGNTMYINKLMKVIRSFQAVG